MSQQTLHLLSAAVSTVVLIGVVVAMLAYTFWPTNRQKFERAARQPLDDDQGPLR
ncbi:MAG: cbb3-type cytochrome c oxidase subunit 3 [Rhodospirillales bacterium]|nr:cbb3-type cytochrome c oxidase subunit 3 [Rhodospirillales bacterium]